MKVYYSFEQIAAMCNVIVEKLGDFKPTVIVGVARGGLCPAVYISHRLGIPMIPFTWQTRDGSTQESADIIKNLIKTETVLIVEDIVDTGRTISEIYNAVGNSDNLKYATVIQKQTSDKFADYTGITVDTDNWVVFPWEGQLSTEVKL